ncbi:MAG: U32 family peptidase [Bacillota bacterium]|nr:U32 family peptidase [Bacillota bacterium]
MSRIFNGREIELLAPVGTFEDFKEILNSGADAFYMGGKNFNMRIHRKDHNLTDEELEQAINMAHERGKKVYITFNNMMSSGEMQESEVFLRFLERVQPDALIIQDFGAVKLIRDLGLNLNMHLSVMANVHNLSMVKLAKALGVTRVVTSREISFYDIKSFVREVPEMEYEYFIHGDMCSVHGSQCLYSGMLFGKSSNRGLCMKPCRWPYEIGEEGTKSYPLAVKDMCLYRHLPELLTSGVNSFKIEGRMRGSEYLLSIIDYYREAIDRFIEDPTGYSTDEKRSRDIYDSRVRNLSTAYAFKKPGASNIDITGEREPRVFSRAVEEFDLRQERISEIKELLKPSAAKSQGKPKLAVKVNNLEALKKACDGGADLLYLAGEVFRPDKPFRKQDIKEAMEYAAGRKLYYVLPRMTYGRQSAELAHLIPVLKELGAAGVVVGNAGELYEFHAGSLEFRGDFNLNIYNEISAGFYKEHGLSSVTLSVEADVKVVKDTLTKSDTPIEIIVQGAPAVMYLEHCLAAAEHGETSNDYCSDYCMAGPLPLKDENGIVHSVYSDQYCKNHIIPARDLCYLPVLKELAGLGASAFRIEAQHYTPEQVEAVTRIYRESIDSIETFQWNPGYEALLSEKTNRKQGLQSLNF